MKKIQVSVILPTFNGGRRISKAISSVLNQSFSDWELLIIDDGSSDDTEDIAREFSRKDARVLYFKNEVNLGIQKSLNRGLKEARGKYIARIDDDDEWIDLDKLKKQFEFMNNNLECVLVGTGVVVVDEEGKELFRYLLPEKDSRIRNRLLSKNCFVHSSVFFRRDKVLNMGGYREDLNVKHLEDYDLWLRIGLEGELVNLQVYGVRFTLRQDGISLSNKLEVFKKIIKLIKNYKDLYPHYYYAIFRSYIRLIIYGFLLKLPISFSLNKIIKIYKKNF